MHSQDYIELLIVASNNPWGLQLVWDHVREHWTELINRFTLNSYHLGNLVQSVTKRFDTEIRLKEVK